MEATTGTVPHTDPTPAITSTSSHLKLLKYVPEAYAGIDNTKASVVILFPEDAKVMELRGDQATTKSSHLSLLRALVGGDEVSNAINASAGTKKGELSFEIGGQQYISRVTKTDFMVIELQDMGEGKKPARKDVREPKTFLKALIGPLGTDPGFLKGKTPADQIVWIRSMMPLPAGFGEMEGQLKEAIKSTYENRTAINRNVKYLKTELTQTPYYQWDDKGKCMKETGLLAQDKIAFEGLEAKGVEIQKTYDNALQAWGDRGRKEQELRNKTAEKQELERRILELRQQLERLELSLEEKLVEIGEVNVYMDEHKDADKTFEESKLAMQAHNQLTVRKVTYDSAVTRKVTFDTAFQQAAELTAKLDELMAQQQKFVKAITPKVPGLEICIPRQVDMTYEREAFIAAYTEGTPTPQEIEQHLETLKKETREGIYYNDRSVAQMSESELWDMWLSLCREIKVRAVFIENVTSLGSDAVARINALAADGCYVFYSAMERGVKELKVSFVDAVK